MDTSNCGAGLQKRRISLTILVWLAIWLVTVVTATVRMTAYSNTPGVSGPPPAEWPTQSPIPARGGRPILVLFVHPHCPCSRATMGELERLMAREPGRIEAHVLFIRPEGTEAGWERTDLWRQASAIPGVTVQEDVAGTEARRFRAETSGHCVVYDTHGHRLFYGGITLSRGHAGDNPGADTICSLLNEPATGIRSTPVFGCSLFETVCRAEPGKGGMPP